MEKGYFENISGTMCDFAPFYNSMASELPSPCVIAEVGVADGYSALYLAHWLDRIGKKFTLYMIDNMDYGGPEQMNTLMRHITKSGFADHIVLLPYSSLDASCRFPDGHFDFVFIDASHTYEETKADARLWYHKIKEGGLLAGHDYYMDAVRMAVDEVIPEMYHRPTIYDENDRLQQRFKPEPCRQVYSTAKGLGVWAVQKKFYIRLQ